MEYRLEYVPSDHTAKKVMFFLSISVLFSSANVQQKKIPRSSYIYLAKKKKDKSCFCESDQNEKSSWLTNIKYICQCAQKIYLIQKENKCSYPTERYLFWI